MDRALIPTLLLLFACTPPSTDADDDLLSIADEEALGTDPDNPDSDGDGLLDGHEVHFHFTDPLSTDSDGDRSEDGWEISVGLDPLDDTSRRYPHDWPHLLVEQKESLQRRDAPAVATLGERVRNFKVPSATRAQVELYDFALDGRPVVLLEGSDSEMSQLFGWLARGETGNEWETVVGNPDASVRELILDGSIRLVVSWTDVFGGGAVTRDYVEVLLGSEHPPPPVVPLLIDQDFQIWGHLGRRDLGVDDDRQRSENGSFVVLDEEMIVRGFNDWSVAQDLLTE